MNRWDYESKDFSVLVGKTIVGISNIDESYSDEIIFTMDDGSQYKMLHFQDCCESVYIEDVTGSWDDIIGEKITYAREDTSDAKSEWGEAMWTFYHIGTFKGTVCLRWLGESNGYYSVSVSFVEFKKSEPEIIYEASFIDVLDMTETDKLIYKQNCEGVSDSESAALKFLREEHPYKTDGKIARLVHSKASDTSVFATLDLNGRMVFVRVIRTES